MQTQTREVAAAFPGFRFAAAGMRDLLRTQRHARIHLAATLAVLAGAAWLRITASGWAVLFLSCGLVWTAEALNIAVELLGDRLSRAPDPLIGRAKDVAAAGVLITAIAASLTGAAVLGPPLWHMLSAG